MATFDDDVIYNSQLDFQLAHGPTLFWRQDVLSTTVEWLVEHGYDVVSLSTSQWNDANRLHRELAQALSFPPYYGKNLDALNDCMFDVACGTYGIATGATGLALVLVGFDHFAREDRELAHAILDIFVGQAHVAMRLGRRILTLVQSDDPSLTLDPVGAITPQWNDREWLDSSRDL